MVLNTNDICYLAKPMSIEDEKKYYVISNERFVSLLPYKLARCEYDVKFEPKDYQKRVCKILHAMFDKAKVLIITRGYESWLRSHYSQYIKTGGTFKFMEYKKTYLDLLSNLMDYSYVIQLYANTFGTENVLVIPYEMLQEDADQFFDVIEKRLDIKRFRGVGGQVNYSLDNLHLKYYPCLSKVIAALADKLREPYYSKVNLKHHEYLRAMKYDKLIHIIKYFWPQREEDTIKILPDDLLKFKRDGAGLRDNPLYSKYKGEYLLDARDESNGNQRSMQLHEFKTS
jgi:hypothetical protein